MGRATSRSKRAREAAMRQLTFASATVAERWPVTVGRSIAWQHTAIGFAAEVELPVLAAGDLVIPSASVLGGMYGMAFELDAGDGIWRLAPTAVTAPCAPTSDARVHTHIDYFSVHGRIEGARLRWIVEQPAVPEHFLVSVSVRPECVLPGTGRKETRRLTVPVASQLTAPRALRRRICSPTCLAMVLAHFARAAPLSAMVTECLHAPTGIYGVWPLAIRAAAHRDVIGCVAAIDDLDAIAPFLDAGSPVVASIRFDRDELPDAPLPRTDGHLVVVTGMDARHVHVNDPASPRLESVPRSYDRERFAAAWLRTRGAAYLFQRAP
jgi:uncharacterized protein YvpB